MIGAQRLQLKIKPLLRVRRVETAARADNLKAQHIVGPVQIDDVQPLRTQEIGQGVA